MQENKENKKELNEFPISTLVFSKYSKDGFIEVQTRVLDILAQSEKTFQDIETKKIKSLLENINFQLNSSLDNLSPKLYELVRNIFLVGNSLPLTLQSVKLKRDFNNLAIALLLMGMETNESQELYIAIHYNCLWTYIKLDLINQSEFLTYFKKILTIKFNQQKALINDFDHALTILNILIMKLSNMPIKKSELISLINQYVLKKLLKISEELEAVLSISSSEKYFVLNINLLRVINFNFVKNHTEDTEELIASMYNIWLNKIKPVKIHKSEVSLIYDELDEDITHIIQNHQDYFTEHKLSLSSLEEMKEYYQSVKSEEILELDFSKNDSWFGRELLNRFTPKFKKELENAVFVVSEFLKRKQHEFKKNQKPSVQIEKNLIISKDIFLKSFDYLLSINELSLFRDKSVFVKNNDQEFLEDVDTHVKLMCSYLIEVLRGIHLEINNEKLFEAEINVINSGLIISQILSKNNINLPHYKTAFFSYQFIILLNRNPIDSSSLKLLMEKIFLIKCLGTENFYSQIDIIFDICKICIEKIKLPSDNLMFLLEAITSFTQKLIDVFNELLNERLSDSECIEASLSLMKVLTHIADFCFTQYRNSNKTNKSLLANGQALIKRVIHRVLPSLKSMDLTDKDRNFVLGTILKICDNQQELFKVEEGKILVSLLEKQSDFLISFSHYEGQLSGGIFLIDNLKKSVSTVLEKKETQKNEHNTDSAISNKKKKKKSKKKAKSLKNTDVSLPVKNEESAKQSSEEKVKTEIKTIVPAVPAENQQIEIEDAKKNEEKIEKIQELEINYKQEIVSLSSEISSLESKIQDHQSREKDFKEEKESSQKIQEKLPEDEKEKVLEIESGEQKLLNIEGRPKDVVEINQPKVKESQEAKTQEIISLNLEISSLKSKIQDYQNQEKDFEKERKSSQKAQEKLLKNENEKVLEIEKEREKLVNVENRLENVVEINRKNKTKVKELQEAETHYQQEIIVLKSELSSLKEKIKDFQVQISSIHAEKASLIEEIDNEKKLNKTHEESLKKATDDSQRQKLEQEKLQNELKLEKNQKEELATQVKALEEKVEHSQKELENLSALKVINETINETENARLFQKKDQEIESLRKQLLLQEQEFQTRSLALIQSFASERQASISKTISARTDSSASTKESWKPNFGFGENGGSTPVSQTPSSIVITKS